MPGPLLRSLALAVLLPLAASAAGDRVENFALLDEQGRFHELYYHSDAEAIVLFVQGNGCPIARNAFPILHELRRELPDVVFLGLNANPQDDRQSVAAEVREYGIEIPILIDETQLVAEALGVTRTAEALLIDPEGWRIVYRGPVDDRLSYGTQRPATRHYLREALEAHRDGRPVEKPVRDPRGCLLFLPDADPAGHAEISYAEEVAPILARRCQACHRSGGVAPWAMTRYEMVRGWSPMMREMIRTRRMPPWHADPRFGRFANDLSLTDEEKKTLVHWIEAGAPRGEGPDPLKEAPPPPPAEWALGEPDLVLELPAQEIPATGVVPYRYEEVEIPLEEDVWIRAVEIQPSNTRAMHHGTANILLPRGHERPRVEGPNFVRGLFAGYVPGRNPEPLPEGTGFFLPAGSRLRFQLHYNTTGREETDQPRMALYFSREPLAHELKIGAAGSFRFRIPPRRKDHPEVAEEIIDRDIVVYRLTPHMHFRGKAMRYEAHYPDGSAEVLLSVPRYDFNWQRQYVLEEPKVLPAGTRLVCHAVFDNSKQNPANPDPQASVEFGEQSWDEMLFGYFLYRDLEEGLALADPP
ncbi:MAG: redoxin domain-containing protein [Myxococcota bacterium]